MELGINLLAPGRKSAAPIVEDLRPIGVDDLVGLAENRETKPPQIARLKERHHAIARYLAQGMPEGVVASIVGLKLPRISQLKNDPLFASLLELYREKQDDQVDVLMEALRGLSGDAMAELQRRFEETPNDFDNRELIELLKTTADRAGYGPVSKTENTHVVDFGEALAAARERARRGRVIEGEVVNATAE